MTVQNWKFEVVASEVGLRLDQLVAVRTGLSRRKVREILKLGGIQVGKKRVRVASKEVAPGTEVRVALDDSLGAPPDLEVPVVFEDAWLLVVNKPAGLPTQGTQASDQHDLLALLGRQRPGQRLILCHRLDQGTSGVLVLAKDPKADLGAQFQERTLGKVYLARIAGTSRPQPPSTGPSGACVWPSPPASGAKGTCWSRNPPRRSCVRPVRRRPWGSCRATGSWPSRGRAGPIRSGSIWPIWGGRCVGDGLYGGEPSDRLWLHAWKLRLKHPVTGEDLELVADPRAVPGAARMKLPLVYNPRSGPKGKDPEALLARLPSELRARLEPTPFGPPWDYAPLIERAREAGGPLLVWGGDGTLHHAGRALVEAGCPVTLGALPGGSGNGLVRGLRTPLDPAQAVQALLQGRELAMDLPRLDGTPFLNLCGTGFEAAIAHAFDHLDGRGFRSYARLVLKLLRTQPEVGLHGEARDARASLESLLRQPAPVRIGIVDRARRRIPRTAQLQWVTLRRPGVLDLLLRAYPCSRNGAAPPCGRTDDWCRRTCGWKCHCPGRWMASRWPSGTGGAHPRTKGLPDAGDRGLPLGSELYQPWTCRSAS